jgi:hypothetical protein
MTGLPDFNYPAFELAAIRLRARGFGVINPAEEFEGNQDLPREAYMRRSFENVLAADGVALLPGWEESGGAKLESAMAFEMRLPVKPISDWMMSAPRIEPSDEAPAPLDGLRVPVIVCSVLLAAIGMTLAVLVIFGLGGCAGSTKRTQHEDTKTQRHQETPEERTEREAGERLRKTFNGML